MMMSSSEEIYNKLSRVLTEAQDHLAELKFRSIPIQVDFVRTLSIQLQKFINVHPLEEEEQNDYSTFEPAVKPQQQQAVIVPKNLPIPRVSLPEPTATAKRPSTVVSLMPAQISDFCRCSTIPQECISMPIRESELVDKKTKGFMGKREKRTCSINKICGLMGFDDFLAFIVKDKKRILLNIPLPEWKCEARDKCLLFSYNNVEYEFEDQTPVYARNWVDYANKNRQQEPAVAKIDVSKQQQPPKQQQQNPTFVPVSVQREEPNRMNRELNQTQETPKTRKLPAWTTDYDDVGGSFVVDSRINNDNLYDDVETLRPPPPQQLPPPPPPLNGGEANKHDELLQSKYFEPSSNELPIKKIDYLDYYLCLYDTTSVQNEHVLNLHCGDVVYLHERFSKDWFVGKHLNKFGLVPFKYVRKVYEIGSTASLESENYENQ